MKKKELRAKLERTIEKLRGDLAALQLEADTKTDELEALQVATCAEVTELKEKAVDLEARLSMACQRAPDEWVPVGAGEVLSCDSGDGTKLRISKSGVIQVKNDDSLLFFYMGPGYRICRKEGGAGVGTTNSTQDTEKERLLRINRDEWRDKCGELRQELKQLRDRVPAHYWFADTK